MIKQNQAKKKKKRRKETLAASKVLRTEPAKTKKLFKAKAIKINPHPQNSNNVCIFRLTFIQRIYWI